MRENLFSGVFNTLLTLAAIFFIVRFTYAAFPWFANGVWDAGSIRECRDILAAAGKTTGACFAVLVDRWDHLLFGFKYPATDYWRPTLAFVLLLISAAPALFSAYFPRKMLILTALYPFVAYWLVWGGTLWLPLAVLAAILLTMAIFQFVTIKIDVSMRKVLAAVVGLLATGYALGPVVAGLNSIIPLDLLVVPSRDMGGYMLCLILGTVCVSLSIPLGILLALGRQSHMPLIKGVCVVFIEFIRGVPLITLLFVANVMLAYFMPPQSNFDLILRVIIMITMFSSAYIAEVIRGGLAALPKGQYEAADSLGLNYTQATQLIILPQALKISIPGIVNVAVGLFKDTVLVSVISMFDIVGMIRGPIQQSTDWISIYWEVYLFAALVFFVVCYGISQYSQWLERRLATDHR
ncbi:UNVERIFIED_CONTAM: hypothetical protein GTU68_023650 [Idotea baltica]|nr:hypothetical protein [Idotea baltica]